MRMSQQLSIPSFPFPIAWLPSDAYLVGGTVRDTLLNRKRQEFDLDLVVIDRAVELARDLAKRCDAGFVVLDATRDIARIVFPQGTVDVAKIEGESLEQDLHRRDFTINSIALHIRLQKLIDPLGGKDDLEANLIKMVSPANLKADPLRLFRAYRQAAQLNFTIDPQTRNTITQLASELKNVAPERIKTELSYLLETRKGSVYLQQAWEDGLLSICFPSVTQQQVEEVARIDVIKETLRQESSHLVATWEKNVGGQSNTLQSLAKLACLVSVSPEEAENQLTGLKFSRAEIRTVTSSLSLLPRLLEARVETMSLRDRYFFFQEARNVFPCLLLTAMAKGLSLTAAKPLLEHYLNPHDPVAYPQPIVTGKDLLRSLSLSPSPRIGELLTELQIAYIEGKVNSPSEAIDLAKSWL